MADNTPDIKKIIFEDQTLSNDITGYPYTVQDTSVTTQPYLTAGQIYWDTSVTSKSPVEMQIDEMQEQLSRIEDQLVMLSRDINMEEKYEELREAYDHYQSVLEKLKTFEILKEDSNGEDV